MAGSLFGIPMSQQLDVNGKPIVGGLLYIYEAATTTPVSVYEDFGLTTEVSNPLETDSYGRIPKFWLDDGSYRARFTDSSGVVIFDQLSITAIGASTGGGSEGDSISEASIFQTGDIMWQPRSGTRTGWVRANGRTIGSSGSSATERANADTQALYEFLWNTFSDSLCAVTGGRGGSASADFAANKPIATLDMRSKGAFGLDDMGNSAAGVSGGSTSAAAAIGSATTSITIAQANLPDVTFPNTLTLPNHQHNNNLGVGNGTLVLRGGALGNNISYATGANGLSAIPNGQAQATLTVTGSVTGVTSNPAIDGSVTSGGSGTALTPSVIEPARVGTWYFRL